MTRICKTCKLVLPIHPLHFHQYENWQECSHTSCQEIWVVNNFFEDEKTLPELSICRPRTDGTRDHRDDCLGSLKVTILASLRVRIMTFKWVLYDIIVVAQAHGTALQMSHSMRPRPRSRRCGYCIVMYLTVTQKVTLQGQPRTFHNKARHAAAEASVMIT